MGIQGLLPFLQKVSRKVDMSEFSGCTVAVDAYCWLHKGAFSCAEKLARGENTDQYVNYCMKYVNMLLSYNIRPILVFDGCHLPAKAETEKTRRERRELTKKKAGELLRSEKIDEARQMLRRCVDITHEMAHRLITRARAANIDCIVAPFEADAQLAFLNISGMAHFVVTEDSDLLLFGCSKVVFKLDVGGNGLLVEQEMLPVAMKMRPEEFSLEKFRQMCVLSGCDYLSSLPGVGLTKACKFVKLTSQSDISKILHKIGSYLNMPNLSVPEEYKHKFNQAMAMFKHQPVFDPLKRCVVPLTPLEEGVDIALPKAHLADTALQLALGNLDPFTLKVVDDWNPDTQLKEPSLKKSIWSRSYNAPQQVPLSRVTKTAPPIKSTFGKRVSVSTEDIIELTNQSSLSEEDKLKELREMWGVKKKLRLDEVEEADIASVDDLIGPSPPRPNPFKAASQATDVLSPSKTLSGITSPPLPCLNSRLKSSLNKFLSPATSKGPTVVSRYFSSMTKETATPSKNDNKMPKPTETVQPIVIPESPERTNLTPVKLEEPKPIKRKIFIVPPVKLAESNTNELNPTDINSKKDNKKPVSTKRDRSLLTAMEEENDSSYESLTGKTSKTSSLSNFKWKPLIPCDKVTLLKTESAKTNEYPLLDTPPNSQETENMSLPKLPSYLEPPRTTGLSRNKSPAMQNFLSKFKFQPKTKVKLKR